MSEPVPTSGLVIDLRHGEAATVLTILTELSKHVETPIHVKGSSLKRNRLTINVTLLRAGGRADLRQEYMSGRDLTIKEKSNHATEHFAFEWVAPLHQDMLGDQGNPIDLTAPNVDQCNTIDEKPVIHSAEAKIL